MNEWIPQTVQSRIDMKTRRHKYKQKYTRIIYL